MVLRAQLDTAVNGIVNYKKRRLLKTVENVTNQRNNVNDNIHEINNNYDEFLGDTKQLANIFNNYFCEIGKN